MRPLQVLLVQANPCRVPPVYPFGIGLLADRLAEKGHYVDIMDPFFASDYPSATIEKPADSPKPDLVGISIRNIDDALVMRSDLDTEGPHTTSYIETIRRVVESMRYRLGSAVPIVAGGGGFSSAHKLMLDVLGLNIGVVGPGEDAFAAIAAVCLPLLESESLTESALTRFLRNEPIPGVILSDGAFKPPQKIFSLSASVSIPANLSPYMNHPASYLPFRTRTGCGGSCSFCIESAPSTPISQVNPSKLSLEIQRISDFHSEEIFFLCDGELNRPEPDHAVQMIEALSSVKPMPIWRGYVCPSPLPEELIIAIAKTPVLDLHLNTVHISDRVLDINRIGHTRRDIFRAMDYFKKYRIPFSMSILAGLPGETEETLEELKDFLEKASERTSFSAGARIYPGTLLENLAEHEPVHIYGASDSPFDVRVFCKPYSPGDLLKRLMSVREKNPHIAVMNAGGDIPLNIQWAKRYFDMGNVFAAKADLKRAIKSYRSALAADPSCEPARINLAAVERAFHQEKL